MTDRHARLGARRAGGHQQPISAAARRARAAAAPPPRGRRRDRRPRGSNASEHFRAFRPAADRHLAADGRHLSGRARGLSRCCPSRRCRRSTSRPSRSARSCRARARRPWPPRWRSRWSTSSRKSPGLSQMTSTNLLGATVITLQFDLNRNIDAAAQDVQTGIDAAGGQLPKNLPTPPTYRKVNPADSPILILAVHSDVLPVTTVDDYAENILAQQISQIPGIAQVAIGGQQKPAVRVQIDPGQAGGARIADGGRGRRHQRRHGRCAEGVDQRPEAQHDHLRQRPVAQGGALERRGRRLQERRAGAHPRHRHRGGWAREHAADGLAKRTPRHLAAHLQATRRQRHRGGAARRGAAAARACRRSAIDQGRDGRESHHDHSGRGARRGIHARAHHSARGHGHFSVPAQCLGDHHPGRHRAARAARHRRDDVRAQLQPGQLVADGAHHRGRIRRGRCDRDAGERVPAHRGRACRRSKRRSRAPGKSASPSCRSASRWSRCSFRCC